MQYFLLRLALALLFIALTVPAPLGAQSIPVHQAKEIQPVKAKEIEPASASSTPAGEASVPSAAQSDLGGFVRTWQLIVEGAARTDENVAAGTRTTTVSSGARGRTLVIKADGTYQWGDIRGRWKATGEDPRTGWPIVLLKADGGKDWKVGWDTRRQGSRGDILVWDGYTWEVGKPAR